MDTCDTAAAATLRANSDITVATSPMSEGFAVVKEALESVYTCMGITCAQVGGLLEEGTTDYISGFEPCTDGAADGSTGTIADMAGYTPGGFVFRRFCSATTTRCLGMCRGVNSCAGKDKCVH